MNPVILFRKNYDIFDKTECDQEFSSAEKYFQTYNYRTEIPENSLVIGRYSVLPFYKELEKELYLKNCKLINSFEEHTYIADITNYYEDIKEFTPKTYSEWYDIPEGKYIVKGKTNSRKHQWNSMMYAENKKSLRNIIRTLLNDSLICDQGIVVREFVPLKNLGYGINGLPFSHEWRMFFYKENLLAHAFYWSNCEIIVDTPQEAIDFAKKVAIIISKHTNFFVLDIAQTEDNKYIVIEVNDGQQSGLSLIEPDILYKNLAKEIKETK